VNASGAKGLLSEPLDALDWRVPVDSPILIDGGAGEGGGQILRTALVLSAITSRPFVIERVRANRIKPGLRPQHREAAQAMARLCQAHLEGAEVGSSRISFAPQGPVEPGRHLFEIGTAGATPLLLQTLCFPLALAGNPSHLTLRGGTHQLYSPTFHYLALCWAPAVARLGFRIALELQSAGFYPEGGGEFTASIEPAHSMPPLDLRHRGTLVEVEVFSMVAGLGLSVAERQTVRALRRLRDMGINGEARCVPVPSHLSRGSHVLVVSSFERTRCAHGAIGDPSQIPEAVADEALSAFGDFLGGGAAVDRYLGDQFLLPAALAASRLISTPPGIVPATHYRVACVTKHLTTTAQIVRRFLDVEIAVIGREGEEGEVRVQPPGAGTEVVTLHGDG
jgi:RNA 3'-terminal phosphate cyclase (ATP)